jgi:hypothetical protein
MTIFQLVQQRRVGLPHVCRACLVGATNSSKGMLSWPCQCACMLWSIIQRRQAQHHLLVCGVLPCTGNSFHPCKRNYMYPKSSDRHHRTACYEKRWYTLLGANTVVWWSVFRHDSTLVAPHPVLPPFTCRVSTACMTGPKRCCNASDASTLRPTTKTLVQLAFGHAFDMIALKA